MARVRFCVNQALTIQSRRLGYQLSHLSLDQWQQTLVHIKPGLAGKSVADVMRFEPLTQPDAEVLVPILHELFVAYGEAGATLDDGLWQPIAAKQISLLLNHFHPQYSPEFYCSLGFIYCVFTQDFEFGYELGRLGIQLMEALDLKEINCRVSGSFNGGIRSYREPLSASLEPLLEAHKIGIETGDFFDAGRSALARCQIAFMCGKKLNWLKGELSTLKLALEKTDYIIGSPPCGNADEGGHDSDGGTFEPVERHHGSIPQGDGCRVRLS